MFDQSFFTGGLQNQLAKVGGNPVVEVTLTSGQRHFVRRVDQATSGYVMFEVYPPKDTSTDLNGPHALAVPYTTIASVLVARTSAEQRSKIGFLGTTDHSDNRR